MGEVIARGGQAVQEEVEELACSIESVVEEDDRAGAHLFHNPFYNRDIPVVSRLLARML